MFHLELSLLFPLVEDQCNDIAKGHAVKDDVIYKALAIFEAKFQNFVAQINKMDVLFSSSFSQLKDIGKPFTRCGLTR
jgi:DNA topoisomerase-3